MKKMNNAIGVSVAIALVCAGGGFYGGMKYEQSKVASNSTQGAGGNFAGRTGANGARGAGRFGGGGATLGTIVSKDATSITVQLVQMGSSTPSTGTGTRIILINPSTQVGKFVTGSVNDLSVGASVTAMGTTNTDGSVTATQVQIRPAGSGPQRTSGQ